MTKRRTSADERALFEEAVAQAHPHAKSAAASTRRFRSDKSIHAFKGGLDGKTAERLRKGEIEPDRRIDLHGLTEAAAHDALLRFLNASRRSGARLVLVITGKGARKPARDTRFEMDFGARGILKSMVPRWLEEPQFLRLIADSRVSHRRHGGDGALYVYLRKNRD
ncbi:MAG TPA: Smr/MutS family protein [Rhizomicrobium sp.]|jgi:DNA-nicking Smr family endonuclease|nr:Smr/MutS family protein [Rhizomicrobium sp.]